MDGFKNKVEIQNQFKIPVKEQAKSHKCEICDQELELKKSLSKHFNDFHNQISYGNRGFELKILFLAMIKKN